MPVEETGNMLLLLAAVAQVETATPTSRRTYWPQLHAVGGVPGGEGVRPREPALHRRLRRPPGAQRQPLGQGDPRPRRPTACSPRCAARRPRGDRYRRAGQGPGRPLGRGRDRRRPHPAGLRPAGDLEPEVQPGLGPAPGPRPVPAGGRPQGDRLSTSRSMDRYGLPLDNRRSPTPSSTGPSGPPPWPDSGRLRGAGRPAVRLPRRVARPRADVRLVLDEGREAGRLPGPVGGRRRLHQAAGRPATWKKWAGRRPEPRISATGPRCRRRRRSGAVVPTARERAVAWRMTTATSPAATGPRPASTTAAWTEAPGGFGTPRDARDRRGPADRVEGPGHLAPPRVRDARQGPFADLQLDCSTTTRTPRSTSTACSRPSAGGYTDRLRGRAPSPRGAGPRSSPARTCWPSTATRPAAASTSTSASAGSSRRLSKTPSRCSMPSPGTPGAGGTPLAGSGRQAG